VLAYSPLAGGLLTGKYRRGAPPPPGTRATLNPSFARALSDRNLETVERLDAVAEDWGLPLSNVALAWVLKNRSVATAIIGATTVEQFDEDIGASHVSLSGDQMKELESIIGESDRSGDGPDTI
jgi:aryl-alcohol dehydrogenase-like predicted oxidoreductase